MRECRCSDGGCLLAWPWRSPEEYEALYLAPRAYHDEEARRVGCRPTVARDAEHQKAAFARLYLLRQWVPQGDLIDVGCAAGAMVAAAEAWGYRAAGIDPSQDMVTFGNRLGRQLWLGGWEDVGADYDLITLCDVLEHLLRPLACLRHLRSRLRPGGALYVEMPEYGSPYAERHVKPRQHPVLYSDEAAQRLFRRAGLSVEALVRPLRGRIGKIGYVLGVSE